MNLSRPLIGMDIGESSIKLSVISKQGSRLSLDYADRLPIQTSKGDLLSESEKMIGLKNLFSKNSFKKNPVVMNYTGNAPVIRYLKLPEMPENELAEAIQWEAKKVISEPLESKIIDYAILRKVSDGGKNTLEIILVAVDKGDVSEGLGIIRRAGVYPALMDVNPLALLKVVALNHSSEIGQDLIFIDIGSSKMEVNISRDGVLRFTRQIGRGGNNLSHLIMEKRSLSFEDAEKIKKEEGFSASELDETIKEEVDRMVLEVQRSIDFYRTQFRDILIKKIILMGGTPLMPGFRDYFETQFDFPVVLENPFSLLTGPTHLLKELNPVSSIWTASIGLALRGKVH
ncbi:MAG: type IV pilus assembly protein PilM [Nitrospirae bacterium]|nr:type IV pilus assembly protein PilM [Nitrospirota bacterium]